MVSITKPLRLCHVLPVGLVVWLAVFTRPVQADPVPTPPIAVIAHRGVPSSSLTSRELVDIVLGRQRFWPNGQRIELVLLATPSRERRVFVEQLSGMSEIHFRQYWIGQLFRARATSAPRAVPDRSTAAALVASLPGAIALISSDAVPDTAKVLMVDGKLPRAVDYPLR